MESLHNVPGSWDYCLYILHVTVYCRYGCDYHFRGRNGTIDCHYLTTCLDKLVSVYTIRSLCRQFILDSNACWGLMSSTEVRWDISESARSEVYAIVSERISEMHFVM
ncbi:hypothetical protein J6590_021051 [Homalodisca vitripennis]|nr:hypothetical protein J6590_021051 [Homalodisca vitripennis]